MTKERAARLSMAVALAAPALLLAGAVSAQEQIQVLKFREIGGFVRTYDANGKVAGKSKLSDLPAPPVPVTGINENLGLYKIATPGGDLWISRTNAELNKTEKVLTECERASLVADARQAQQGKVSRGLNNCK